MQQGDDPPYLSVGTEVSAKYKGAFCEAKVRKVVRNIKCKVTFKQGLGTSAVTDEQIKGTLRVGVTVEARHPDRREFVEAVITKIQDCSQYTVVFDDGDITTLRRSALCLKSGRHFNESETLDQLPLTHPEHFGNPVIGGRRGRRSRQLQEDSDDDDEETLSTTGGHSVEKEEHIGKVVCVETSDSKKRLPKETWFPGLVVAPTAQVTVRIRVRDEYLVRSFKDGRYYTVPKKEATEFTRELASRQEGPAVTAALRYLDNDDLPPHWDRDALFGLSASSNSDSEDGVDTDSSADEPIEEKDHFVAQLYKFMDDRGTPFNQDPIVANRDIDLYRLFSAVQKLGGYSRVTGHNQWKAIAGRLGFTRINTSLSNLVKQAYKKYLHSFDEFYRKLGCTMISHTRGVRTKGRSLIRNTPTPSPRQQDTPPVDAAEVAVVTDEQEKTKIVRPGRSKPENVESPQEPEEVLKTKARVIIAKKIKELKVEVKAEYDAVSTLDTDSTTSPDQPSLMICPPEIETPYKGVSKGKAIMPIVKIKEEPKDNSELVVTVEKKKVKAKKKTPGGKVKALINKYEEKVKQVDSDEPDIKEVKDEPLSIASTSQQNTRSKSKDEIKVNKEPLAPELKIVKIIPVKEKEKDSEVEVAEIDVKVEPKDKDKEKEKIKDGDKEKDKDKVKKPDEAGGDKRRGRKRKETDTADNKESLEPQMIAKGISIDVGDKLKVFYHESKVTYEAKVIEIDLERSEHSYLVHYTGWNTRYDEWVRRDRIAENLSAGGKAKRLKGQGHNKSSSKPPSALKRGRGLSSTGRPPGTDGPPNLPPRSTTPSSVTSSSSRTKSPATPGSVVTRRVTRQQDFSGRTRGRRTSVQTDISLASGSDSDGVSSDMETDTKHPPNKRSTSKSSSHDEGTKEPPPNAGKGKKKPQKKLSDDLLLSEIKGNIKKIKEEPGEEEDSDDETLHKGRDFDLNQIRSELKGFKEVVKAPTAEEKETEVTSRLILDDKTGLIDVQRKSEDLLNETQKEETIKKELVKVEKTPEKVSSVADIYEFKEPEPFEFEARKPVSEEKKKRPVGRIFEEMPELKLDKLPKRKMPVKVTSKTSNEGGKKGSKKTVEKIEDCDVEAPTLTPQKQSSSPDMFDKLCESPSFNLNKSASPVLVAMDPGSCTSTTLEMESLSIFDEIETTEDSGDRLVMLESEDTNIVNNEEPLFTYQQELFPSIEDKTSRLLPLFPGLRQDTFLTKSEDGTKSNKDSSSSEEDPIDAAIQRVISQTLCDEDSQEIDLLLKKETSIFEPTASNIEIVLIEKPVLLETNAKSEMITDTVTENIDIFDQENIMPGTSIIDKLKAITDGATLLDELENDSKGSDNDNSITLMSVKVQDDKTEVLTKTLKTLLPVKRPEKLEFVKKELFMRSDCAKNDAGKSITKVMDNVEKDAVNSQPIVQKNNVLNETILKLETAMQQSGSVTLPELESSFQDESSDSTDSEQRLIIDKLSDDECQQTDSNSCGSLHKKIELAIISLPVECPEIATSDAPKTESSEPQSSNEIKTEETVVETKVEKVDSEPETESNICLLLCEETIPGSPAPLTCDAQPVQETVTKTKPKSAKSLQMELPFASAVNIGGKGNQNKTKESTKTVQVVTVKSVESFVPPNPVTLSHKDSDNLDRPLDNSPPNTPESTLSNLSPRDERVLSPMEVRKVRDSSSMELDSGAENSAPLGVQHRAPARGPAGNIGHGGMSEDDSRPGLSKKLDAECDISPKKRRRSRKASECESSAGSCSGANPPGANPPGANPPGTKRTRRITRVTSDSDTSEAILRERERDTSGRPNRYNFTVQLDPSMDSNQRISLLMQTMEELRKNYNRVKSELMGYERKRKKLRRREREAVKAAKTAEISV